MLPLVSTLLTLASISNAEEPSASTVRRFALVAAANDGGQDRAPLRYAVKDAKTLLRVLNELGGVDSTDEMLLEQPTVRDLRKALSEMGQRIERAKGSARRLELVVYYSGHSDASGLLLGDERFSYPALKSALAELPADVRIAILDSCSSGAMTRTKGGRKRPPFIVDAASRVKGYAVLTSSSEDEAAQESDRIGASFFTHYLVSGLRGAGDLSQDGRVTLNEAYHFAFHETLARTENTLGGPQHPAYDIQLVGSGDVVMTDLRSTSASLTLDKPLFGHLLVRDERGHLAVELRKVAGRRVELGLSPGSYTISLAQSERYFEGVVQLREGRPVALDVQRLTRVETEQTSLRGTESDLRHPQERRVVPLDIGIFPSLSINGADPALNHVSLSLGVGHSYDLEGVGLALGGSWIEHELHGMQAAIGFAHVGDDAAGAQASVGFNNVGGSFEGLQSSVGFNLVGGSFRGLQASVGFNRAGLDFGGVQTSVGFNMTEREFSGLQSAVGFNYARGVSDGLQLSVGLNLAPEGSKGGQIAVGANYSGPMEGLQVAAGVNIAERLGGAQLGLINVVAGSANGLQSGLVNVAADSVEGVQVGLVNVSLEVKGFQLGLINVVKKTEGLSLGLINYALDDGILDLRLYSSDVAIGGIAAELGTKHVFTAFSFAAGTWQDPSAVAFGASLGGRAYISEEWELSVEAGSQAFEANGNFGEADILSSLRATLGFRPVEALLVFAGPTFNVLVDLHDAGEERHRLAPSYAGRPSDDRVYLWPGLIAGLQFF